MLYAAKKLLTVLIVLWIVVTVEFSVFRLMGGDPYMLALPRDPSITLDPENLDRLNGMYEKPLIAQYPEFVGDMLTGDFFISYTYGTEVSDIIYEPMWRTAFLLVVTVAIAVLLAAFYGYFSAGRRSMIKFHLASALPLVMLSLPVIAWGWFNIKFFAIEMDLFPAAGHTSPRFHSDNFVDRAADFLYHSALPLISLVIASFGAYALAVRDGRLTDRMRSTHVDASLGQAQETPGLRSSLFYSLPVLQFLTAGAMGFVIAVEYLFSFFGLGRTLILGIERYDLFLVQAAFFLMALLVLIVNLALDIVITVLRPNRALDSVTWPPGGAPAPTEPSFQQIASREKVSIARELHGIARAFARSPVGIVSLLVLLVLVGIAVVGPSLASDDLSPPFMLPEPSSMFLRGATAPVAVGLSVGIIAGLIGLVVGIFAAMFRPYFDFPIMAVAQGLITISLVPLLLIMAYTITTSSGYEGYWAYVPRLSLVVAAPVAMLVRHGVLLRKQRMLTERPEFRGMDELSLPLEAIARKFPAWLVGGVKYGAIMAVTAVFITDFIGVTHWDSWGEVVNSAFWYDMILTGDDLEYVIPAFSGMFLLLASLFLTLDTLERVLRERYGVA